VERSDIEHCWVIMYASDKITTAERYRLREDLRRLGKLLDRHFDVPEPSREIGKTIQRLCEAEDLPAPTPEKQRRGAAG
jgi:hypothetical protein